MVAGKDAPTFGEAKNSWLTGTAAWTFVSVSQAILGIKPELEGLRIDPCVPSDLKSYTVTRRWRGADYVITVSDPEGRQKGVRELIVDGERLEGSVIPARPEGSVVKVTAVLG